MENEKCYACQVDAWVFVREVLIEKIKHKSKKKSKSMCNCGFALCTDIR